MSKVKRSVLKQLIKECLVEILIEGLDSDTSIQALTESARRKPLKTRSRKRTAINEAEMQRIEKQRTLLDSRKVGRADNTETAISSITQDPIMADIFRDTASTTLKSQGMSNDARGHQAPPADQAAAIVRDSDLEQLFEGSKNWAHLAFETAPKK